MNASTRKFLGMGFLFVALTLYAVLCVHVATTYLPDHWLIALIYYTIVGVAWAFPAKKLLEWMHSPDADKDEV